MCCGTYLLWEGGGGAFERCSSSLSAIRQSCCHKGKWQWNQPRWQILQREGVLLLAQSEKRHRMEVRTTRDLVQPMISIRQSVKSAHDRVPKRRGRDCPHWPRFETQMASGARCYIVYTSFAPLVHKSRTIFISVVTKVVHPIECI